MDIINPVLVTALYDIGRDKWEKFTQSYGGYLHWMERTLSIDANIVIYTQEKFKSEIERYRKKYDTDLKKTIIVIQELDELDAYKLYNQKLVDLMFSESFMKKAHFDVPEMNQPLYNVIMFNKVFWIKDCIDNNYFNNDLVIWVDAGGLRDELSNYTNKVWPNKDKLNELEKNKIIFFSHNQDFGISNEEYHSLSQIRNIQGTAFLVPSLTIDKFMNVVHETIIESIDNGYIGSDEKIFDICYIKDKEMFSLIKSTWREYYAILN